VLTWGRLPLDLDLQLSFMTSGRLCQVGYFSVNCGNVRLNIQNRLGGTVGCETITITNPTQTVYQLSVNMYPGQPLLPALIQSGAQVDVYAYAMGSPIATYFVPSAFGVVSGTPGWWNVFCIDGVSYTTFNNLFALQGFSFTQLPYIRNCTGIPGLAV